jgi:folylpolyglutamate synthase/dihydropteroate synthase
VSLRVQHELKKTWEMMYQHSETFVIPTIKESVEEIRSWDGEKEVFVVGSLYLISGLFKVLDGETECVGTS